MHGTLRATQTARSTVSRLATGLQAVTAGWFLVAVFQADRAMDKSGVGNPAQATIWNTRASVAFEAFWVLWTAGLIAAAVEQLKEWRASGRRPWQQPVVDWPLTPLVRAFVLPPGLLALGWLFLLVFHCGPFRAPPGAGRRWPAVDHRIRNGGHAARS
jgi:hypothetical protein